MEKFCLCFSSGKDSMLALDRMLREGGQPIGLITSMNDAVDYSWFHGIPPQILEKISDSLNIPLVKVVNNAENYEDKMVSALKQMRTQGATVCGFGDIDIEQNGQWDSETAKKAGLIPLLPLWQEPRQQIVEEFMNRGFIAIIKTISKASDIPLHFLGQPLTQEFFSYLNEHDLDVCGENGEYHTLVIDGPLFTKRIDYIEEGIYESDYAYSLIIR
ncbi:hypothetical protein IGI37_003228 [Enterococcus sp. AZ194]|uniref:Dph6-related ATP pyrophosphatase n=1 Tax=Enterococcus sp. AZ194 TaxID=2774629 RepID=UPI003F1F3BBD